MAEMCNHKVEFKIPYTMSWITKFLYQKISAKKKVNTAKNETTTILGVVVVGIPTNK
jgi:hypothetical protein